MEPIRHTMLPSMPRLSRVPIPHLVRVRVRVGVRVRVRVRVDVPRPQLGYTAMPHLEGGAAWLASRASVIGSNSLPAW